MLSNITVVVLRGGPSGEHDVSLQTGATVLQSLQKTAHDSNRRIVDVFIDKNQQWYVRGVPVSPERALNNVDVVWNALHGEYGEDGSVQELLTRIGVPYTGSTTYASKLGMNKMLSKETAHNLGIKTPYAQVLKVSPDLHAEIISLFRSFPQPSVIKPFIGGSSVGVTYACSFADFERGIKNAFQHSPRVIIEEYIPGKEATVGAVDRLRGDGLYVLPPTEIKMGAEGIFDYEKKYKEIVEEMCPGNFSLSERDQLSDHTKKIHEALGLRHYSRSDFRVSPKGVYFIETNTLPGLTETSLLPKGLRAVGVTVDEFIEHVLSLALKK